MAWETNCGARRDCCIGLMRDWCSIGQIGQVGADAMHNAASPSPVRSRRPGRRRRKWRLCPRAVGVGEDGDASPPSPAGRGCRRRGRRRFPSPTGRIRRQLPRGQRSYANDPRPSAENNPARGELGEAFQPAHARGDLADAVASTISPTAAAASASAVARRRRWPFRGRCGVADGCAVVHAFRSLLVGVLGGERCRPSAKRRVRSQTAHPHPTPPQGEQITSRRAARPAG